MDIRFWSFLRSGFTRLLDVGHWVQGLGRFSSLPEALRYVNARLSDWLYWKRERLLVILRSLKSPREIYRHIRRFLDEHFRNIRLLRRSAVGAVLGIVLAKLMTLLYLTFAGAIVLSVWGFDCIVLLLGVIQFVAVKIGQLLSRVIEHHIYQVQNGAASWVFLFQKRAPRVK
jgi:conserved domain protein